MGSDERYKLDLPPELWSMIEDIKRERDELATENEQLKQSNGAMQCCGADDGLSCGDCLDCVRRERDEARTWAEETVKKIVEGRVVTCVYCGHKYEDGTPTSQDERLTEHIRICEKHPMRQVERERDEAREDLQRWG